MTNDSLIIFGYFTLLCITCCICWFCLCLCLEKHCKRTPIQSQCDRQQRSDLQLHQLYHQVESPFQDQRDHQRRIVMSELHQLQVDLRPYEVPIVNSVTPSAPRLDPVDLPPSYEEAVMVTIASKV